MKKNKLELDLLNESKNPLQFQFPPFTKRTNPDFIELVIEDEGMARSACQQLVEQGKNFTCFKVEKGWQFEVEKE